MGIKRHGKSTKSISQPDKTKKTHSFACGIDAVNFFLFSFTFYLNKHNDISFFPYFCMPRLITGQGSIKYRFLCSEALKVPLFIKNRYQPMKISYNWLRQYLPINMKPEEVSEILTGTGLEVEVIEKFEPVTGVLEGVVVGKVVSCRKHPNAEKLTLTGVDVGNNKILQIVCGADNVAEGLMVPVALEGATLTMNERSLTIRKTKIRGEISEGMICAEDELGLGESHEGIMVLEPDAVPGTNAVDYFRLETDTVFEIGLTPNRIDAASHFGVARDLAAWLGQNRDVKLFKPGVESFEPDNNDYPVEIVINDQKSCLRYSGLTISGVKVTPSPAWLQNRLRAIGLKPINNVVDITNYVLFETGQPLHAFNADLIKGKKVIVGQLPEGTSFITLDENKIELSAEDLMICNAEEGMCIAGIFGGIGSSVDETATNIFLESACFDPVSIRKSSRRHGINTDASFRFERGTDPSVTVYVLKRAALLIKEIAGGKISSEITDVYPKPVKPVKLDLDYDYVDRLVGEIIPKEIIKKILTHLDFIILAETATRLSLEIPLYRVDVTRKADVVEEILRIYGYNKIAVPESLRTNLSRSAKPDKEKYEHSVADLLTSMGFNEIICNSLTSSSYYRKLSPFPEEKLVKLINPLSSDLDSLRQTLLFGGLESVLFNTNRKNPDLRLYEFGNVYSYRGSEKDKNELKNYRETRHLALFLSGTSGKALWNRKERPSDFFDIKAYVNQVFRHTGLDPDRLHNEEIESEIFLYGLQHIADDKVIAEYGPVHPEILKKIDLKNEVYFADIRWDELIGQAAKKKTVYRELPRFPEVRRDLAMELDKKIKFQTIREIALETENILIRNISLFDVYEGKNIADGKKSYAISFYLQDIERTLTDSRIDAVMDKLAKALEEKAGARIRR